MKAFSRFTALVVLLVAGNAYAQLTNNPGDGEPVTSRVLFAIDEQGLMEPPVLVTAVGVVPVDDSNLELAQSLPVGVTIALGGGMLSGLGTAGDVDWDLDDGEVDFSGRLEVIASLQYEAGDVQATLKSGHVTVDVQGNSLTQVTIGTDVQVDATIRVGSGEKDVLKLNGQITNGKYKPGERIDFDGSLELQSSFVYDQGALEATLSSGVLNVSVRGDQFVDAAFLDVEVEVEVTVRDGQTLRLNGSLDNGAYQEGKVDFDASLTLDAPFEYSKGKVTTTLLPGSVHAKLHHDKKKSFFWAHQTGPPLVVVLDDDDDDDDD